MMTMKELNIPIRRWVPEWVGVVSIFIIILPIMMLNGSYMGSMVEVAGTLGTDTEDITTGFYAAAAGMAITYPILPKVFETYSTKQMLLVDMLLQVLLCFVCAHAIHIYTLIICSFLIGFLKGFVMLWFIKRARRIFSPKNIDSEFYAYFYPLVYGVGELVMVVTAEVAYIYNWKYMYYLMMLLLMIAILVIIIFYRHDRPAKRANWKYFHIRELMLISTVLLMIIYVLNYGKVLDWMSSPSIIFCIIMAPIIFAFFLWIEYNARIPYIVLLPLYTPKIWVSYFFMATAMFLSMSTTMLTPYITTVLKLDALHTCSLYMYFLPGYVIAAVICFWWIRLGRWDFRYLVTLGLSCFVLFFAILYFGISPSSTYEMLYIPIVLRNMGQMILVSAFAWFAVHDMERKHLLSYILFLISFRSILGPVAGISCFSNWLYYLQQKYTCSLTENFTWNDPLVASSYTNTFNQYIMQGHGYNESMQLATENLSSIVQQQSTLLALKDIFGVMMFISLVIMIITCFIPFNKFRAMKTQNKFDTLR